MHTSGTETRAPPLSQGLDPVSTTHVAMPLVSNEIILLFMNSVSFKPLNQLLSLYIMLLMYLTDVSPSNSSKVISFKGSRPF